MYKAVTTEQEPFIEQPITEYDVMSDEQREEELKVVADDPPEKPITPYQLAMRRIKRNMENEFNCIPLPFPRLRPFVPGTEQFSLNMVTGSSGVGKSQLADFLYMYSTVNFALKHPDQIRLKIDYYSLEMSPEMKAIQAMAYHLYIRSNRKIRVSLKALLSLNKRLDKDVYNMLKKEESFYEKFYEIVTFKSGHIPPYVIYKDMYDFAEQNGTIIKETVDYNYFDRESNTTKTVQKEIFSDYKPNDPSLYYITMTDHAALLARQHGANIRETIGLYSQYMMSIRNMFGFIATSINQQASDQESKENYKKPTLSGLGDNKATQRDYEYIFGIYDPARHDLGSFNGWPIGAHESKST